MRVTTWIFQVDMGCAGLIAAALLLLATDASAQTAVCSNMPAAGERIECIEPDGSTEDVVIDAANIEIDTTERVRGIYGRHEGAGNVRIAVRSSQVTTNEYSLGEDGAHAIQAEAANGAVVIKLDDVDARTTSATTVDPTNPDSNTEAIAVSAVRKAGVGDIRVTVSGSSLLSTQGTGSYGLFAEGGGGSGDIDIYAFDTEIITQGHRALGIFAVNTVDVEGDIFFDIRDSTVTTSGDRAHAVEVRNRGGGEAKLEVVLTNTTIETRGQNAQGVAVRQEEAIGDIVLRMFDSRITTISMVLGPPWNLTYSHGVLLFQMGVGEVVADIRGGNITTKGIFSPGLFLEHSYAAQDSNNEGGIHVRLRDGASITTTGNWGHGIATYHWGTHAGRTIVIDIDRSSVVTEGEGAQAIRVGDVDSEGNAVQVPAIDADGYPTQTVRVNGRVTGGSGDDAAGIFLAGGGRVIIGPKGSVSAKSGIAIHADGNREVDDETVAPKLLIHLMPDGGPVHELFVARVVKDDGETALVGGRVVNDGGETTLAVNGTVIFDSAAGGRQQSWAPNGARDVRLAVGFPFEGGLDFSSPDAWADRYGPRAAVYEVLSGALLHLNGRAGDDNGRVRSPGSPIWVRLKGGAGSYEPDGATVGADYDFSRYAAEVGMDAALTDTLSGSVGARHVSGSADVSALAGGGTIDATGHGLSLGLAWNGTDGVYGTGRVSTTWYGLNLASDVRGTLERGIDAQVQTLDLEAGWRLAVEEGTTLTPRVWLSHSDVSVDDFTDAVDARVSVADLERLTGGFGGVVETDLALNGEEEELSLYGSLGLERTLGGAGTEVLVSGETLRSKAPDSRLLLGFGGTYRQGDFALSGAAQANGVDSGNTEYSVRLNLQIAF